MLIEFTDIDLFDLNVGMACANVRPKFGKVYTKMQFQPKNRPLRFMLKL